MASLEPFGVDVVHRRPKGAAPSSFVQLLRKHVEGATLEDVAEFEQSILVSFVREGTTHYLGLFRFKEGTNAALLDSDLGIVHAAFSSHLDLIRALLTRVRSHSPKRTSLADYLAKHNEATASLADRRETNDAETVRKKQLADIDRALRKLIKRREAIERDLANTSQADRLRSEASFILANKHLAKKGDTKLEALDYALDEPKARTVPLDRTLSPTAYAERLFKKAKKLETGLAFANKRLAQTEDEIRNLEAERNAVEAAEPAALLTPQFEPRFERRLNKDARIPYRTFTSTDGKRIYVGRGAKDNDELTFRLARPHDLWFHARGVHGAHVLVPLEKNETRSAEVLLDACSLAAHFSDARDETIVEVSYVPRKFLKKPKGGRPGAVLIDREEVFTLRVNREHTARLLTTENTRTSL